MHALEKVDFKLLGFIVAVAFSAMSLSALVIDVIYCLEPYAG